MTNTTAPKGIDPPVGDAPLKSIDPRDFRTALGNFATGVTIITANAPDGRYAGLTCNSFAAVSLNPALVLWSLLVHSPSMTVFQDASHFAVNVLCEHQIELAKHFARPSPDKFAGIPWKGGLGGAPLLLGCVAHFQCRNSYRYYGGDHVIFLGAVEAYEHICDEPLLFSRGKFGKFMPTSE